MFVLEIRSKACELHGQAAAATALLFSTSLLYQLYVGVRKYLTKKTQGREGSWLTVYCPWWDGMAETWGSWPYFYCIQEAERSERWMLGPLLPSFFIQSNDFTHLLSLTPTPIEWCHTFKVGRSSLVKPSCVGSQTDPRFSLRPCMEKEQSFLSKTGNTLGRTSNGLGSRPWEICNFMSWEPEISL